MRNTWAGGDYFGTMGIEIVEGVDLAQDANPRDEVRAVLSRSAADRLWPGENPLGKQFRPAGSTIPWITVGGIVEDILLDNFRQQEPDPMIYLPLVGQTARSWTIGTPAYVVKSARAETIAPDIRELIAEVAPGAPMYRVFTMRELAARSMAELSFTMITLTVAAALALILGAVGIYGTLSYVVSQRTREIGIRMALGAEAARVRRMVVTQGAAVVLVGVAVGVGAALMLSRVLESLLFGIAALDALTFAAVTALMLGVAVVAAYYPARRASAVDPVNALRQE
jgi:ABC-type antimicrobial peptide transport system permease subunit